MEAVVPGRRALPEPAPAGGPLWTVVVLAAVLGLTVLVTVSGPPAGLPALFWAPAVLALVAAALYAVRRLARIGGRHERPAGPDPLTGLADRIALGGAAAEQVADHAARLARGEPDHHLALVLLDIDGFRHVNEALGHAVGDRLLVAAAERLAGAVGPRDLVARLGGDEFAVLAARLPGLAAARELAVNLAAVLTEPICVDGLPLEVGASIGVSVQPEHGEDAATLMRGAEVAMYEAKRRGHAVVLYAPESDHNPAARLGLLADLRRTLEYAGPTRADQPDDPGEIVMYYQPQVEIGTGAVIGVEALPRWRHPRRGMVGAAEVLQVAQQSAVMRLLTRRVIDEVIRQLATWAADGIRVRAALNVSVRDLHSGEIVDQVDGLLSRYGVPPAQLQLEITEGALNADPHRVVATIARLDRLGVAIALDDFGTGYASLRHLRRLPLSEVKVDRSVVLGMGTDAADAAIVRSIIELATALGLRVVADGVEDERTWRLLHAAGCHAAQGWFHARPMPPRDLAGWLARYRPTPARPPVGRPAPAGPAVAGQTRVGGRLSAGTGAESEVRRPGAESEVRRPGAESEVRRPGAESEVRRPGAESDGGPGRPR